MRLFTCLIALSAVFACNQKPANKEQYGDAVLKRYFALADSSGKIDTTDQTFMLLKAYATKDTAYLTETGSYLNQQFSARPNWDIWPSDIPLPPINKLNADAAFRFVYSIYGAPTYEVITLTQKDSIRTLHYLCYSRDREKSLTEKKKEFSRPIDQSQWQEMASKMLAADFWGLKPENIYRGADGYDLTVMGYQKLEDTERYHSVHRWSKTTLDEAFYFVYFKLLDNNERMLSYD